MTSDEEDFDERALELTRAYFERFGGVRSLVQHQIEAFNYFVTTQQRETLRAMGPVLVKLDDEAVTTAPFPRRYYARELLVHFEDIKSEPPVNVELNGARKVLFPHEARVRQLSYASRQTVTLRVECLQREQGTGRILHRTEKRIPDVMLMNLPVMFRSVLCNTTLHATELSDRAINECPLDPGGYFIFRGQEKTILQNQSQRTNMVLITASSSASQKYLFQATMKFAQEGSAVTPKHLSVFISRKRNMLGHPIFVYLPRLKDKHAIELFVFFRALGAKTDTEILNYVFDGQDPREREAVKAYLHASALSAPKDVTTVEQAVAHIKQSVDYEAHGYLREDVADRKKTHYTYSMLREDVFPQWPRGNAAAAEAEGRAHPNTEKMMMLGQIVRKLIWTALGWCEPDSRDAYLNKRMNGVNCILNDLFRHHANKVVRGFQSALVKQMRAERKRRGATTTTTTTTTEGGGGGEEGMATTALSAGTISSAAPMENLLTKENVHRYLKVIALQKAFDKAMNNGDFSTSPHTSKVGYCQILKRLSAVDALAHLNRIMCCTDKNNEEIIENRKFDARQVGHLCLLETPENAHVGQILQLAISARTTLPVPAQPVLQFLQGRYLPLRELDVTARGGGAVAEAAAREATLRLHTWAKVFVNGVYLGVVGDPRPLFRELKVRKRTGELHLYTSVVLDFSRNELRVCTESGRTVRPVLVVDPETDRPVFSRAHLRALRAGEIGWDDLARAGAIEYIDAEEQWFSSLDIPCLQPRPARVPGSEVPLFDYAEISYAFLNGLSAALIPFIGMNPSARNTYMSNMGKQSVGHYVSNYARRMDRTAYVQMYPGVPLVRNSLYDILGLQSVPSGMQVNICFMCYDGTNQEDSVTLNAAAVDRGLFNGFVYHTVKDEDKTVAPEDIRRQPPDPSVTIGVKDAVYGKTNRFGVMNPNQRVNPKDVFMTKVVPLPPSSSSSSTSPALFEDMSRVHNKSSETAYVNANYLGRAGDGSFLTKTTLRAWRVPSLGDKFATRQAQKDTCGRKIPEHLMPHCMESGIVPDVILNTHCIPSRMTMALIQEMMLGKVCLMLGARGDSSQREDAPAMRELQDQLRALGVSPTLQDVMVDPRTGRVIQTRVFHGPAYLTNLKHQTIDKDHYRNIGPVVRLHRQPTEGRASDGGMRVGEMERDALVSHGGADQLHDRFYECSDKFSVYVCPDCGMIMPGNNGKEYPRAAAAADEEDADDYERMLMFRRKFQCRLCGQRARASEVQLPYAYKLHMQEMGAINVAMRIHVETGPSPPA